MRDPLSRGGSLSTKSGVGPADGRAVRDGGWGWAAGWGCGVAPSWRFLLKALDPPGLRRAASGGLRQPPAASGSLRQPLRRPALPSGGHMSEWSTEMKLSAAPPGQTSPAASYSLRRSKWQASPWRVLDLFFVTFFFFEEVGEKVRKVPKFPELSVVS